MRATHPSRSFSTSAKDTTSFVACIVEGRVVAGSTVLRAALVGVAVMASAVAGCTAGSSQGTDGIVVAPTENGDPEPPSMTSVPAMGEGPMVIPDEGTIFDPDDVATQTPVSGRRRGLLDKRVTCDGAAQTTISGTVYIPSGALPIYNAMVYVPDADLAPLTPGASCGCQISGSPIATTLTDSAGRFVLPDVPVGDDIPIVVQVGDWRREFNIGTVSACADTAVPDQTLRLPARHSEGDMPRIAAVTGIADALECLVRKIGIDPSEFTSLNGSGRVQLYAGDGGTEQYGPKWDNGSPFPPAVALWDDLEYLKAYDVVLLSCEGDADFLGNKSPEALQAMHDYLNLGGRVFGSHYQEVWFAHGPDEFQDLASYQDENVQLEDVDAQVVTSFPKGQALAEWLVNVGASPVLGQVQIQQAQNTIFDENPAYAQRWIETAEPESVQYISANTPLGAAPADQCGRLVLSDIHVSPGVPRVDDQSRASLEFPEGCITEGFTPQEAVLAFMFFDISSCIVPDDQAPVAPPPIY